MAPYDGSYSVFLLGHEGEVFSQANIQNFAVIIRSHERPLSHPWGEKPIHAKDWLWLGWSTVVQS